VSVPDTPVAAASAYNIANALTVSRLFLVPVFLVLLFADGDPAQLAAGETPPATRLAACAVFVLAVATDKVDGDLARRRGLVTNFGKIADPIADKALIGAALIGLSLLGELAWWITVVIMAREIGVTLLRFAVLRHGVIAASHGGKLKTSLQCLAITLLLVFATGWLHDVAVGVMWVAVAVTAATGVEYVVQAVRLRREALR